MITEKLIKTALSTAKIGGVSSIIVKDSKVFITIEIAQENLNNASDIENSVYIALSQYLDRENIKIIFTNQNPSPSGKKKYYIDNVKKIILVSSGKGGVGK